MRLPAGCLLKVCKSSVLGWNEVPGNGWRLWAAERLPGTSLPQRKWKCCHCKSRAGFQRMQSILFELWNTKDACSHQRQLPLS